MKSLNVKKLVAVGVAAAIAATPVAFAAQTFNTSALPTAKDWYLNSVVVVGSGSAPSDAVWAGNIAAAIANMAYTEEQKEVSVDISDAEVKLKVSGQLVIGENGYAKPETYLNYDGADVGSITVGSTELPALKTVDLEYSYKDGSGNLHTDTTTASERLSVAADFALYKDADAKEAYPVLEVSGVDYNVTFTPGIPGGISEDKNDLEGLEIPILGQTYIISKVDTANKQVTLVGASTYETIGVGQEKDVGDGYKIKVIDVSQDGTEAMVQLTTPDGDTITKVLKEGDQEDFGVGFNVYVKDIFAGGYADQAYVTLGIKSEKMTLSDGDNWKNLDDWQVSLHWDNATSPTKLEGIEIKYIGSALTGEDALKEGDKFQIAGSDLYVSFKGLDNYATREIEFAQDRVKFYEYTTGKTWEVYYHKDFTVTLPAEGGSAVTNYTLNMGDISLKIEVNAYDTDTNTTNGTVTPNYKVTVKEYKFAGMEDYATADSTIIDTPVTITTGTATMKVNIDRDSAPTKELSLQFSAPVAAATPGSTATIDVDFAGFTGASAHIVSKDRDVNITYTAGTPNSAYTAVLGRSNSITVYVGNDYELNSDAKYDFTYGTTASWTGIDPDDYKTIYTENYDKVELSTTSVTIYAPVKIPYAYAWVGVPAQTQESEDVYTKKKGETLQVGDYDITIEDIVAPEAKATYTEVKPIDLGRLVYLDNEVPSGKNLIVVGGYYVNSIAAAIAEEHPEIKDAVAQEGDYIVDKYTYNGKDAILVFGYTADDTAKAAQEFLNWLKQNVQ